MNKASMSKLLMVASAFLFLMATLISAGVISSDVVWLIPGGLTALALAFAVA